MPDYEQIGSAAALCLGGFLTVWAGRKGAKKSNGESPPERAPTTNETKAALEAISRKLERQSSIADEDRRDIMRSLDRIERMLERASAIVDRDCGKLK